MKKQLKNLVELRRKSVNSLLRQNGLTDGQRDQLNDELDKLNEILAEIAAMPDEVSEADFNDIKSRLTDLTEAVGAIKERMTAAPVETAENGADYLKSDNAVHDFARIVRNNGGFTRTATAEWLENVRNKGVATNAVSGLSSIMPAYIIGRIHDNLQRRWGWLSRFTNTGAKSLRIPALTSTPVELRAEQHKRGTKKNDTTFAFNPVEVSAEMIYEVVLLDKMTEWEDDFGLVNYIVDTLTDLRSETIAYALLSRPYDGTAAEFLFTKIVNPAITSTGWAVGANVKTAGADTQAEYYDKLVEMAAAVSGDKRDKVLIITPTALQKVRQVYGSASGSHISMTDEDVLNYIRVSEIVESDTLLPEGVYAAVVNARNVFTVGSLDGTIATWEDYMYNQIGYRLEAPFGATIVDLNSIGYCEDYVAS